jgi:hypothetical protein
MHRLWEQNKSLVIVAGTCAVLLFVVRPNVFDFDAPPLAGWLGRGWGGEYADLEEQNEKLDQKLKPFQAGGERIDDIAHQVAVSNARLQRNFDDYVHALAFVPYQPFLPPVDESPGHYFRETLTRTRDRLLQYGSLRFVGVGRGLGFERFDGGAVPSNREVPQLLRQLAVADTFVRRCADFQIASTRIEEFGTVRTTGTHGRRFIREYPFTVKLSAGYDELTRFLDGLHGHQAGVKAVEKNPVRVLVERVTLNAGTAAGIHRDERFVLFKRAKGKPCKLTYVGLAKVVSVADSESVAEVIEESLPPERLDRDKREGLEIAPGDLASTGFFKVDALAVVGIKGEIAARDKRGIPNRVVPNRLNVTMELAAIDFYNNTVYLTPGNIAKATGNRVKPPARAAAKQAKNDGRRRHRAGRSF